MRSMHRRIPTTLGIAVLVSAASPASAQTATVDLSAQKQYIRGYGGMVHAAWAGDLTAAERTLAFGNADGQLGFTILRIPVTDGSPDSANLATAKAAVAAGAIVFASPWNSSGAMNSSDFSSYATHLNNFVSYMKNNGVNLYAISVQNEPDYGAQAGWRSWTAAQCHDFVLNYGASITTKLMSCESFNYTKSLYDPILNDSAALANMGVLGTHLYGTAVSAYPYPLFDSRGAGKERWMTEHYTDSTTDANSWPNALGVATELHNSMVEAQFNAYTWWYIKRSYGPINNGAVTKRGWCMAHWSKFVRPGFYRVDATKSPTSGVAVSAFKGSSDVVVVMVNTNTSSKSLTLSINGSSISSYDKFTTSSSKSLANDGKVSASNGSLSVALDAQSVTTLHGSGNSTGTGGTGTGGTSSGGSSTGGKATGGSATGGLASGGQASGGKATGGAVTGGQPSGGKATGGATSATGGTIPATGGTISLTGGTSSTSGGRLTGGTENSSGTGGTTSVGGTGGGGASPETCNCRTVPSQGGPSQRASGALFGMIGLGLVALRRRRARRAARCA
jgi:glucuronoarabinoxylan endo-1,4-beta-xylanase